MQRFLLTIQPAFALMAVLACAVAAPGQEPTAEDLAHFEKKIRPLLAAHCYECHGPEGKAEGNLRLDSQTNWLKGGDTGAAIVAGKPDDSPFIKAIRYGGEIEMPPTGKLPADVIKAFEEWVARGAPAPKGEGAAIAKRVIDLEAGRRFWAYQPIGNPPLPKVNDSVWPSGSIDHFVLAKLEAAGLAPSEQASRESLARRVYFDLLGLPPTPEQIDEFLQDQSPDAYQNLVERLLDSKHFGERFGRHWLDVARYGESLTLRGFIYPNAWRYRDYVIDAFHRDLPYDEFVRQQVAGDLLVNDAPQDDLAERQRRMAAATFLTLGNNNLEEQDKKQLDMDVVDEQLDVLSKAFLAQTVTCARCHDHKFDPIPTHDYYALAGILRNTQLLEHANVSKWVEAPLPLTGDDAARFEQQTKQLAQCETELTATKKEIEELRRDLGETSKKQNIALSELPGIVVDDAQAKQVGEWKHSQAIVPYIGDGYLHDLNAQKGEKTLTFTPKLPADGKYEVRLAYSPGDSRSDKAPVTIFGADGEKTVYVNMKPAPAIDGQFVSLGEHRFEAAGQSFVIVANEGTTGHVTVDAVQFLPVTGSAEASRVADASTSDSAKPPEKLDPEATAKRQALEELVKKQQSLEGNRKSLAADIAKRPMAMSPRERKEITDCAIHLRGSVHTLGAVAPRGFLQVATKGAATMPSNESGRRELAAWIASSDNPLTARVYVNRIWHWLFGAGIVTSVDNFGTTGELPSHPELLDHLAAEFIQNGWSTKKLVRSIILSKTYRQSVKPNEASLARGLAIDPENRLLWRASRKRLEAECLRDSLLAISGRLTPSHGGPTFPDDLAADYGYVNDSTLRSVYLPVFRNALPAIFEPFDFADPSMVVGARNVSTIAPQALYLLNNPFPRDCATAAAEILLERDLNDDQRIDWAFRSTLSRLPSQAERAAIRESLGVGEGSAPEKWARVFHALFCSLDFRYRD